MGFFSIKSILRLFIKACTVFSFLLLIVLCFFLIFSNSSTVSAEIGDITFDNTTITCYCPDNFYNQFINSEYFNSHYYFVIYGNRVSSFYNTDWRVFFVDKNIYNSTDFNVVYNYDTGYISFTGNNNISYKFSAFYSTTTNPLNNLNTQSGVPNTFNSRIVEQENNVLFLWSNYDTLSIVKNNTSYRAYFPDEVLPLVAPTIENFQNNNVITSMEHGEYFDIIINSNDYYEDDIIFNMNNGDLELDAEGQNISFVLNENSPYLLPHVGNYLSWKIPKADLIPIYNNCTYNFTLHYGTNASLSTTTESLTTDFSALGLEMANVDTQDASQKTADELSEMNDFLKDDSFDNNSIINDMPNSDEYTDPADGGLLTIFTALETAFTDDSNTPVRFYIPFTDNKYIDLPPDLTISHVPQVILTIIQGLYWYIICRYIVKDISKTANKAKSGELLDSKDGNIRTDLL